MWPASVWRPAGACRCMDADQVGYDKIDDETRRATKGSLQLLEEWVAAAVCVRMSWSANGVDTVSYFRGRTW
mgnify:CR=1 FL=1